MARTDSLRVDRGPDGVATIVLTNPGRRNALPIEGWHELARIVADLDADPQITALVLTGEGGDFSAGLDLSSLRDDPAGAAQAEIGSVTEPAEQALLNCSKPVISKIRGYCVGGGMLLSIACDLRVAASDAIVGITPAKLGIVYPASSVDRLVRLVGPGFAKRLLFTAELLPVERAARAGLVDDIVPPEELDAHVAEMIERMRAVSQLSISAAKAIINGGEAAEIDWPALSRDSGEQGEGVAAFLERRSPEFPWRSGG